ncbi:MAG: histidine phosphatase family protein [Chloroflexota bacterium]
MGNLIVHIVRHGQSFNTHRPAGEAYPPNPPLTPTGVAEARLLAERLGALPVDRLVSSPMRRAIETASLVGPSVDRPIEVWARCYEHRAQPGYWSWGGRELRARYPALRLPDDLGEDDWYFGEESPGQAIARADAFIDWLDDQAGGGAERQLVVVTHGAFTRIVLARALSIDPRTTENAIVLDNTSVTTLRLAGGAMNILSLNDTSHLANARELDPLRGVSR